MATNTLQERNWQAIEKVLPSGWQELARSLGVIKKVPEQLGAKIKEIGPLLRLVLFHVSMHESLRIATARAAAAKVIDISPVALHLRMRKLGAYLRELLRRMVEDHGLFSPPRWAGYELIMVDGTSLTTDGAQGTSARVHYAIRLEDVNVVQMEVTDETGGETFKRFAAKPGQLWVADRGYSNPPGIHSIVAQGADVLVRVNRGALPVYTPAGTKDRPGKRIDLLALVRTHKKRGHPYEIQAWVHPEKEKPIPGRLLMLHLPKEQAQEARARARSETGSSITVDELDWAEHVVLWTTVPAKRLNKHQLFAIYRARWQVELVIKRDKSITGLGAVPNFRKDTIESWLLGKLLAQQISLKLAAPAGAFSP